jgi:signal transduction histidine kinase
MSSWVLRHRLEGSVAMFWVVNLGVIWMLEDWTTVPVHFIWVSLTILYGYTVWRNGVTGAVLIALSVTTMFGLWHAHANGGPGIDELSEIPLMALMFLAMVWHARRREAALEAVRESAERERAFARDASHLLRTPIAVARGHADLVRAAHPDTQTGHDAGVILNELERLTQISQRLLILASADHREFLRAEQIELEELIVDTARRWGAAADRKWVVTAPYEGTVTADREQLGHALDALIENALRFTGEGDTVEIAACEIDGVARITVADSGCGIAPELVPTVFDCFQRTPRTGGGAGLGLPMVRAIAEAHGGTTVAGASALGGAEILILIPSAPPARRPTLVESLVGARKDKVLPAPA